MVGELVIAGLAVICVVGWAGHHSHTVRIWASGAILLLLVAAVIVAIGALFALGFQMVS